MAMVLFVVGLASMTSCTKNNEKLIVGKWKMETVALSSEGISAEISVAQLLKMAELMDEDVIDPIVEFTEDGYVYVEGEGARYTIDKDYLTLSYDGECVRLGIEGLSSKSMTLSYKGMEEGISYTITMNLKKM